MDNQKAEQLRDPTLTLGEHGRTSPSGPRPLAAKPPSDIALPPGWRLFEYRIDATLGQGGFGIAYKATDVNLAARVVIKEYMPEAFARRNDDGTVEARDATDREFYRNGLESFLSEARTLASFRHPHIVRVARFFEANETAYMVLEYERGESLKSWRRKHGENIPEAALVSLLAPLLDGLSLVHASGYLHRDIKPDNIYVRDDDGSLVLLDFGAARQTSAQKTEMGQMITPGYAPIEQYTGAVAQGPWTDIYAFGATLFWLLTGHKPTEAVERLGDKDPLPRAEILLKGRYSAEFLRAIDWMLRMRPEERPQSVGELRSALFASHAGALGLQEALKRGDERGHVHGVKARLHHVFRGIPRPSSWPIAVKMTLAMVATALAPMLLTAYYNLTETQQRLAQTELRNLEDLAQSTAGRISQVLAASRSLADYVGTDDDFVDYLSAKRTREGNAQILSKLDGLVKANGDIQFAMVMDRDGNAVVASDPDVMGKNFRFRQYFKEAIEGKSFMTGIIVGSVAGASGLFFSRPIHARDGKTILGAMVLRIKAEPIGRILALTKSDEDRIPFLVDGDGVIVWHPQPEVMFKSLAPLPQATLAAIVADQRFRRATIESIDQPELARVMTAGRERGNVAYHSRITHRDEIAGIAPVPGIDWTVGVAESRDFFAAPIERLFEKVVVSVLLAAVVFVALALIFARSIVRPIEALTSGAEALKAGDYDGARVEARNNDEIGRLARTFNVMVDVLKQRERERKGVSAPDRPEG